jgi:predicted protein tyrosine phosphatase
MPQQWLLQTLVVKPPLLIVPVDSRHHCHSRMVRMVDQGRRLARKAAVQDLEIGVSDCKAKPAG